jgi:DNA (cytosine-5)-methyltransferase 1
VIVWSVCSGIGAPEVAWADFGWTFALMSEIEAFPRRVLIARHGAEDVRFARKGTGPALFGDFTAIKMRHIARFGIELPDILVAGTPCQAFSVAGLRKSLDDDRGNLRELYT